MQMFRQVHVSVHLTEHVTVSYWEESWGEKYVIERYDDRLEDTEAITARDRVDTLDEAEDVASEWITNERHEN